MKNERCLILSKDRNNLTREEINRRRNKTEKNVEWKDRGKSYLNTTVHLSRRISSASITSLIKKKDQNSSDLC